MSVVATESSAQTEQSAAPNASTNVEIDVNLIFEQAGSLIDLSHPGTTLSPLEPSTTEPSREAAMLVGTADLSSVILILDGASESESFDAVEVIAALAERLSETMSLELHTIEEATDRQVKALAEATTFRTSLTAPEAPMGELRFAVASIAEEDFVWVDVDGSRWRYAVAMFTALAVLAWFTFLGTMALLIAERRIWSPVAHVRLARWTVGLAFTLLPDAVASILPDHHPDDFADPAWFHTWLDEYDATDGTMPLWQASVSN